jgi:hypothetical protein
MKRSATFFASLVLSTALIGCGEPATPPAGKMDSGAGADTGPATKGEAAKVREKVLEDMKKVGPYKVPRKSQ